MRVQVQDMTFVVRSAGERTLHASSSLLRELVAAAGGDPGTQVAVIAERPFSRAVRRTYEIGLDARRPWVVGIDADVLLLGDAIERIGWMCAMASGSTFTVVALVLCKFYGGFCYKGMHCYPRRLLDRALAVAEAGDNAASLRPESAVVQAMEAQGFGTLAPPVVFGLHDHGQYLRHIYIKMRLRGRRGLADERAGKGTFFEEELAFVQERAGDDADYLVASWGLLDGREDARGANAPTQYDWDGEYPELTVRMREHGLSEKAAWRGTGLGWAEREMGAFDYLADRRTPQWIRERLGFERGASHAMARIGVDPLVARTIDEAALMEGAHP